MRENGAEKERWILSSYMYHRVRRSKTAPTKAARVIAVSVLICSFFGMA
jgi:hypothetical protein